MNKGILIRPATAADEAAIRALLGGAGLPVDDLGRAPVAFMVAEQAGEVVGAAGLERLGPRMALLRSFVVKEPLRGGGLGAALLTRILDQASAAELTDLFLLTTTAARFFAARGFSPVAREEAPAAVRAHPQFTGLCPASAVLMRLSRSTP